MKEIKMINKQEVEEEPEQEQNVKTRVMPNIKIKEYELVKIPTQHTLAIQTPEGEVLTTEYAIVEILNKLIKMEKALLG